MSEKDFIITKDLDEVAKIHSNPQYATWRCEHVDDEYRFYSPTYKKQDVFTRKKVKEEETYATLEQLEPLLSETGYIWFGHGTGRMGNSDEVVDSIFREGLRTKDNSLYFTAIGLSTPTPELKKQYKELDLPEPTIERLKNQFNNWEHLDSKKIIIARIPTEYVNNMGDRSDREGEMFGAFYNQKLQPNGKKTNYLSPKFIVGCFDVEKQAVRLNKNFEQTLSEETIEQLKSGYEEALAKTKARLSSFSIYPINQQEEQIASQEPQSFDFESNNIFDFPDLEWEDSNTIGKVK